MVSVFVVDLVFQISIFAVLGVGMFVERKRKIKWHAQLVLAAVVLNIVSFLAVMGPAWDNVGESAAGTLGLVAMGHVGLGGLAFLLSFWLIGSWLLSPLMAATQVKIRCYGSLNKKLMWAVLLMWLASLILGILLYAMVNTGYFGSFPNIPEGGN
jgi:hypothetical protein